jgi:hypothetical protein
VEMQAVALAAARHLHHSGGPRRSGPTVVVSGLNRKPTGESLPPATPPLTRQPELPSSSSSSP